MLAAKANVNLSRHWQFLLCATRLPVVCFQAVGIGKSGATTIGRRSGAQRGALEDKLRPEVFLDAPCIFPSTRFHLADGSPPLAPYLPPNQACTSFSWMSNPACRNSPAITGSLKREASNSTRTIRSFGSNLIRRIP